MTAPRALTPVPLVLAGDWSADGNVWSARAQCATPLVCVSFLVRGSVAHWAKSRRLDAATEALRVAIGSNPADPMQVTVGFGFSIAVPTRLEARGWRPLLAERRALESGIVWRLCVLESDPTIELAVLFLAAADIRFGRNRLWRLRAECEVAAPLRGVLAGGRSGTCAWPLPRG